MTFHEFITSSDLAFGDIMINSCDPEFVDSKSTTSQVYRLASYGLFANRVIVPSRYLLQPGVTFDAVRTLTGLLEEGIVVPDLREGYSSFVEFLEDKSSGALEPNRLQCAQFLDDHARAVYSFDISGQSELYHKRLIEDISEQGLLRRKIDPDGVKDHLFERAIEEFAQQGGSRRTFKRILASFFHGQENVIQEWAALRYYTTPAELEPRCFRDFPSKVSAEMRRNRLSAPMHLADPDRDDQMPEPMRAAYRVLIDLPADLPPENLMELSSVVCKVRDGISNGAAKFAKLSERGFAANVAEANDLFQEAVRKERKLSQALKYSSSLSGALAPAVSWVLGISLDPSMPLEDAVELGIGMVAKLTEGVVRKEACPFIETASKLETEFKRNKFHL